jgi:tetratricopeptide (TPR) repeat protein
LLETRDVRSSLERMMRPPGSRLSATLAQEVAQREGASAVVAGEIAPLGDGYVLSVRLLEADGDLLVAERETARNAGEIIAAVERLSKELREDIGESLRGLRAEEPLQRVSTASLEALRLYSDGDRANNAGRGLEAVRLLEQAVAVDSGFAMAWRKLAVVLGNWGFDPARREFAARRAWELRDRLPRREGALATAYYFHHTGHRAEALDAYRQLLAVWPDDVASRNNLALLLNQEGQFAEAEALMQQAVDSGSTLPANFDNLLDAQFAQRKYDAAESTLAVFVRRRPEHAFGRWTFSSRLAQVRGDYSRALAFVDSATKSDDPARRSTGWERAALLYRLQGRLREGEAAARAEVAAEEQGGRGSPASTRLNQEINQALVEAALLGRAEAARRRLATALERDPLEAMPLGSRPYALLVWAHLTIGDVEAATALLARYRKLPLPGQSLGGDTLSNDGMLALVQGRPAEAIALLRQAARSWGCFLCNLVQIGEAFERLGQADSALAAYQYYADHQMYWFIGQEVDLARTLIRMGELYEQRGDRARALEAYQRFLDMWEQADPELQPRVAEIRKRVGELAGEPRT